jgi:hypothetical protein
MRAFVSLASIGLLGLCALATPAEGQYRGNPLQTAEQYGRLRLRGRPASMRSGPQLAEQRRYRGALTRPEKLRGVFSIAAPRSLLPSRPLRQNPIRSALESHNLLGPRSEFGKRMVNRLGRGAATVPGPGPARQISPGPPPAIGAADDDFEAALRKKADDAFELGLSYFRDGDWTRADDRFTLVRTFEDDRPRAFLADVFVSFNREYYNRAMASLLRALDLAKGPEDLKIDRFIERMYAGENFEAKRGEFLRTLEKVNALATANPDADQISILQAYFTWLNGDWATARNALDRAAKRLTDEEIARRIGRLRALLKEAADSPAPAPSSE